MMSSREIHTSSFASECRFCGTDKNVIVNIFESDLADKATKLISVTIDPTDPLPNFICQRCETSLVEAHSFVETAVSTEIEFRRRCIAEREEEDSMTVEYLEDDTELEKLNPVDVALEKLKSTAVVIKRIPKVAEKHWSLELEPLEIKEEKFSEEDEAACNNNDAHVDESKMGEEFDYVSGTSPIRGREVERVEIKVEQLEESPRDRRVSVTKFELKEAPLYTCQICSNKFASFEELLVHIDTKTDCTNKYPCPICDKVLATMALLKTHQKRVHTVKTRYPCQKCERTFTNTFDLDNHRGEVHGEDVEELGYAYRCCDQQFQTRRLLQEHVATHKVVPVLCASCGKSFKNIATLKGHQRTHSDERPYVCEVCGQGYKKRACLIRHGQLHTGIKIFRCDQCPKSFAKKDSLKKHYKKLHSDEPIMWSQTGEKLGLSRKRSRVEQCGQKQGTAMPNMMEEPDPDGEDESVEELEALEEYIEDEDEQ